jgi:hypothetical protein
MADPYLDPDEAYASDFLPSSALNLSDIGFHVKQAERDVIQHFTRTVTTTPMMPTSALIGEDGTEHLLDSDTDRNVYLRYYEEDAADIDETDTEEAAFLEAMRATIAEVVLHRIDTQDRVAGIKDDSVRRPGRRAGRAKPRAPSGCRARRRADGDGVLARDEGSERD